MQVVDCIECRVKRVDCSVVKRKEWDVESSRNEHEVDIRFWR